MFIHFYTGQGCTGHERVKGSLIQMNREFICTLDDQ